MGYSIISESHDGVYNNIIEEVMPRGVLNHLRKPRWCLQQHYRRGYATSGIQSSQKATTVSTTALVSMATHHTTQLP